MKTKTTHGDKDPNPRNKYNLTSETTRVGVQIGKVTSGVLHLPCTAEINRTAHQSRNLHLAQSAKWTRCIRTSYTGGVKGRRHKGQWSMVRSIETLESSIVGSCSVCMISPSSCTTISRLGPGYYKALPSHILYYFKVH